MKTKNLFVSVVLTLFVCTLICAVLIYPFGANRAYAEEAEGTETEIITEVPETEQGEESETDKKVNILIGKVNGFLESTTSKWETTWKPLIIGGGTTALGLLGAVFFAIKFCKKARNTVLKFRVKNKELETEKNALTEKLNYMEQREQEQNALIRELTALNAGINKSNEIAERTDKKVGYIARGAVHAWAECAPAAREAVKAIDGTVNEDEENAD